MSTDDEQRPDVSAVQSLADEVDAAEAAVRDNGDGRLSAADRVALDAARRLVRTVRHHAEPSDDAGPADLTDGVFEHKAQEGGGLR